MCNLLPAVKLLMDGHEPHFHQLFVKQNTTKEADKPLEKTLFVLNIPPYISAENLQNGFEDAGEIKSVVLCPGDIRDSSKFFRDTLQFKFRSAFVVFRTTRGLQNALKLQKISSGPIKTGAEKWGDEFLERIPNPSELQEEIDSFMQNFDEATRQEQLQIKQQDADDDGWVKVTKKSNNPVIEKRESIFNKISDKIEKGKAKKELRDFYRFQIKDSKMKHIVGLRKRFEEDKKKIELLKKSRRFKPF